MFKEEAECEVGLREELITSHSTQSPTHLLPVSGSNSDLEGGAQLGEQGGF